MPFLFIFNWTNLAGQKNEQLESLEAQILLQGRDRGTNQQKQRTSEAPYILVLRKSGNTKNDEVLHGRDRGQEHRQTTTKEKGAKGKQKVEKKNQQKIVQGKKL